MTDPDPLLDPLLGPGFRRVTVDTGEVSIAASVAGSGSPVLMLHGYPQNRHMWRLVAPAIARHHTVVLADTRGYGDSSAPVPDAEGAVYSKRAMARDQVALMSGLGFDRFDLVGHDRGARVAHRLVLDHPETVGRVAFLDIVPTRHVLGTVNRALATAYYHWFLLATGHGIPEHLLKADPAFWVRSLIEPLLGEGSTMDDEAMRDYIRTFTDETIDASCADYRSGASLDLVHDDASWDAGQRVDIPALALWGDQSYVGRGYDTMAVWRQYASDVRGHALHSGHFVAEEQPQAVTAELVDWLR